MEPKLNKIASTYYFEKFRDIGIEELLLSVFTKHRRIVPKNVINY